MTPVAAGQAVTTQPASGAGAGGRLDWPRLIAVTLTIMGGEFGLLLISAMSWRTDAAVYWMADLDTLYAGAVGGGYLSYLYSPAFAQAIEPFRAIPLESFVLLARLTALVALLYLAGPWSLLLLLFAFPVTGELLVANIHLQLAAVIVLGLRWPALWAFPLLTKPTLGIGLLWFVVRREWRSLRVALGTTALIAAGSFLLAPHLWSEWLAVMARSTGGLPSSISAQAIAVPLPLRLAAAACLVTWGARTDRRWTLAVASTIALPTFWLIGLSMSVACIPLVAHGRRD